MLLFVGFVLVEDAVPLLAGFGAAVSIAESKVRECREGGFVGCIAFDIIH